MVRDGRGSRKNRTRGRVLGMAGSQNSLHPGRKGHSVWGELRRPIRASAVRLALCPVRRKESAQASGRKKGDTMRSVFRAKHAGGRTWGGQQPGATASGGRLRRLLRDSRGEGMRAVGTVSRGQPEGDELRRRVRSQTTE